MGTPNQLLLIPAAYVVYDLGLDAVPRLHCGFAVAIGIALAAAGFLVGPLPERLVRGRRAGAFPAPAFARLTGAAA